jgi:hypothetical protein
MQTGTDFTHRVDGAEIAPHPLPIRQRVRRVPGALLLTVGYYASRAPRLSELLGRRH